MDRLRIREEIEAAKPRAVDGTEIALSTIIVQPDQALLASIDAVLADVLGTKVREAIYDYLARERSLAKEDIPSHMDEFCLLLRRNFGEGANTLQRCIVRNLYSTLGWQLVDIPHFGLVEHVEVIKGIVERAKKMNPEAAKFSLT